MLVHSIRDDAVMADLGVASKMSPDLAFLRGLHDHGRTTAKAWLASHFNDLGKRSSVDVRAEFL
jgi:NTE family protein